MTGTWYEIVHVINARYLIDSGSYQRAFEPAQVGRFSPGFYIVLWSSSAANSRYGNGAHYIGPFPTRRRAEEAHEMMDAREPSMVRVPSGAAAGIAPCVSDYA